MFERFTDDARAVVALASEHARRLGHRYVGGEHLLLAAVTAGQPASTVMCARGVTPELVEEEIVRRVGLGAGAGLFGGTGFAWYVFASAEGRAIARNIFLDGNTFRDSLSVDKRPFVADFQLGAVLHFDNLELTYTYVARTEEFETQGSAQQFGSVGITYRF